MGTSPSIPREVAIMELDTDKIDQAVLALFYLGRHEGYRVWKGFDWAVMNRRHEKGYITDPISKAHSVLLTEEGTGIRAAAVRAVRAAERWEVTPSCAQSSA
jgi:hypothetical protein